MFGTTVIVGTLTPLALAAPLATAARQPNGRCTRGFAQAERLIHQDETGVLLTPQQQRSVKRAPLYYMI